jgi:subtilisin family serine protease
MVFSLVFTMGAPTAVLAQDGQPFTATPLYPDSIITVAKASDTSAASPGMISVIVKLKDKPLATYTGGVPGLDGTSPRVTGEKKLNLNSRASQAYLKHLENKRAEFKSQAQARLPQVRFNQDFDLVLNGVAVAVPVDQISELAALPDVEQVLPDELLQLDTDNSPQFIGAPAVWDALGGQGSAGEGVIVGVLDTGIWPEHPSFSDPDPNGKPYAAPPPPLSGTRACDFNTGANPGPAFTCNNKLIGARFVMNTYLAQVGLLPGEFTSARDDNGHGTHTSSTSAGNANVPASVFGVDRGLISGIAPRAQVIMYRVCGDQGCFGSDSVAAVQAAIRDGVDVINFSISGGANPYADAVELAFLDAYSAGVFVSASAGNSGPAADTTDHRGPWVTTVAASTQNRGFESTAAITGDGGAALNLRGASITSGVGPAPVVIPTDPQCNTPLAAGSVTGQIVVCRRGVTGRAEKGFNVLQGGAAGMILYNQAANVTDLETDNHYLPTIHVQYADGKALVDFLAAHTNVTATLTAGEKVAAQGDVMASFSSRGGLGQSLGVSKPDITAPGVQILAGHSPQHVDVAGGPQGELFQAIAGTSMSSPHIAGSGALLAALHPDWTPGQIKSALMTTAWTDVVKENGVTPTTPFDDGSGRVDLTKAGDPGLTFDVAAGEYAAHGNDLWNTNYPSVFVPGLPGQINVLRTPHSLLDYASRWQLKVRDPSAGDFKITVPDIINVPAGGDASINISIDASNVPIGEMRTATLYLTEETGGGNRQLHLPITFIRKQAVVSLGKVCSPASFAKGQNTTCDITIANNTFSDATVSMTDKLPKELKLVAGSVVNGSASGNGVVFNGTIPAAQPPDITIAAGTAASPYLPLSLFGIAPISGVGDDTIANFNVPAFTYGGETYSRVGISSNGYIVVGGGSGPDNSINNQNFPDATRPNNVLAAFWTDLNPSAAGAVRVATLTDGADTWLIVDWAGVREFSAPRLASFEIWIGVNGDANPGEDVSFAYGEVQGNGDGGFLSVGAENRFGNRGQNVYYNGTGTLPAAGTELRVSSVPGFVTTQTVSFKAQGVKVGPWVNYASLTSNLFQGTNVASFAGQVTR